MNPVPPMPRILLLALFAALPALSRGSMKDLPEEWLTDWAKAVETAKTSNKPILAVFSAEWCGPCQMMIKQVYPQPAVREMLKEWVAVYVDDAQDPKTHEKFQIEGYPTYMLLSPAAEELDRFVGGRMEADFIRRVKGGHESAKRLIEVNAGLEKDPDDPMLLKELGDLSIKRDEYDKGIESYRKAVANDPGDKSGAADDLYIFDSLPKEESDVKDSLVKFEAFAKKFPKSDRMDMAEFYHARILAFLERYDESIKLLEATLAKYPESDFAGDMANMIEGLKEERGAAEKTDAPKE